MGIMEKFEKNVKSILEEKGMSQAELARRMNTAKSTVSNWLKSHREPTISSILKIMEALDCTFEELVD